MTETWLWTNNYPSGYIHFNKPLLAQQPKYKPSMNSYSHGKKLVHTMLKQGNTRNMTPLLPVNQHKPMPTIPIHSEDFTVQRKSKNYKIIIITIILLTILYLVI